RGLPDPATNPYRRDTVLAAPKTQVEPPDNEHTGFYRLTDRRLLHFSDERSYTLVSEANAAPLAAQLLNRKPGGLDEALRLAQPGYPVVVGMNPSALPKIPAAALPAEMRIFAPLLEARWVVNRARLTAAAVELEYVGRFADARDAETGATALREMMPVAREAAKKLAAELGQDMENAPLVALLQVADAALRDVQVKADGDTVRYTMRAGARESTAALLVAAPHPLPPTS